MESQSHWILILGSRQNHVSIMVMMRVLSLKMFGRHGTCLKVSGGWGIIKIPKVEEIFIHWIVGRQLIQEQNSI